MKRLSGNFGLMATGALVIALLAASFACAGPSISLDPSPAAAPAANAKGKLFVSFLFMPPTGEIEPAYHTVIWLADQNGKLLRTLYVSQELSNNEFKLEEACKDWVKQANWGKAEKDLVDAVTGPTPDIGSGTRGFIVDELGIAPGTYQVMFTVNIFEGHDVTFVSKIDIGGAANTGKTTAIYNPEKPPGDIEYIRDVEVQYVP